MKIWLTKQKKGVGETQTNLKRFSIKFMNKIHMICARKKTEVNFTFGNWCEMYYTKKRGKRMKSEKCLVNCLWVCEKHIFLSNVKSMIYIFLKMISNSGKKYEKYEKYESCHDDISILL